MRIAFYAGEILLTAVITLTLAFALPYVWLVFNPQWQVVHNGWYTLLQASSFIWGAAAALGVLSWNYQRSSSSWRRTVSLLAVAAALLVAFGLPPFFRFMASHGPTGSSLLPENLQPFVLDASILVLEALGFSQVPFLRRQWRMVKELRREWLDQPA